MDAKDVSGTLRLFQRKAKGDQPLGGEPGDGSKRKPVPYVERSPYPFAVIGNQPDCLVICPSHPLSASRQMRSPFKKRREAGAIPTGRVEFPILTTSPVEDGTLHHEEKNNARVGLFSERRHRSSKSCGQRSSSAASCTASTRDPWSSEGERAGTGRAEFRAPYVLTCSLGMCAAVSIDMVASCYPLLGGV